MGAAFFSAPEWELSDDEGKRLAAAIAEVDRHYPIPGLSDEHAAILGLVIVSGSIYAPRIIATANRRKAKRSRGTHSGATENGAGQTATVTESPVTGATIPDIGSFKPAFMN